MTEPPLITRGSEDNEKIPLVSCRRHVDQVRPETSQRKTVIILGLGLERIEDKEDKMPADVNYIM